MSGFRRLIPGVLLGGVLAAVQTSNVQAQGLIQPGAGGTHRSMAGASTAMGVDALGALYWNPAAISTLPGSEVVIGGEAIIADIHLGSTVPAGAFGLLGPAVTQSGLTRSDSGVALTSGVGLVYREQDSPMTMGVGIVTLAGGGVNFPGDPANPILAPTGPLNQFILGPQVGSLAVIALMPTVSYQVSDRLAVGGGPMLDISMVSFDPAFFGPPSSPTTPFPPPFGLAASFPTGSHSRPFWGGGFRAGVVYLVTDYLAAGFSFTSPQWFEEWEFNSRDADGNPFTLKTRLSLPTTLSAGVAYTGIERLTLVADVRWLDYRTTDLLGEPVVDGGANWDSVWAFAVGVRYQLTERLAAQAGYLFTENPVSANLALFNTQLPAIIEHTVSLGAYYQVNEWIGMSVAYVHGFENSITGSVTQLPLGTSTTIDAEYDSLAFGLHIKFGPGCGRDSCATAPTGTTAAY